jgi:L-seryl-tRNA(Ser) seleniumtransferase
VVNDRTRGVVNDLAQLPQVDAVLRHPDAQRALAVHGRRALTDAVRDAIDAARGRARQGDPIPDIGGVLSEAVSALAARQAGRLRAVLNATGVVLHTNLGRAPLSEAARKAAADTAGYSSLEFDLASGERGSRTAHLGRLAAEACGAEAATVVNNGAAALVLVLAALSTGREAIVSRGELVEIGGSFRLPEVMTASGAVLHEVGTTNRTTAADYRTAIGERTGLLLKVHRSNFELVGFTTEPTVAEIAAIAREHRLPLVHDLGSGLLRPADSGPFAGEPAATAVLGQGADLVVFSGDKLLGGPQAGIIAGRADLVRRCARHPLARALRIDKLRRAALEVTLEAHLRTDRPVELPVWAMLTAEPAELAARAEALVVAIGGPAEVAQLRSLTGGGSLPGEELPSHGVRLRGARPDALAAALRRGDPPVVGRVDAGTLVLDLRTVPPSQDEQLADLVRRALDV